MEGDGEAGETQPLGDDPRVDVVGEEQRQERVLGTLSYQALRRYVTATGLSLSNISDCSGGPAEGVAFLGAELPGAGGAAGPLCSCLLSTFVSSPKASSFTDLCSA